MYKKIILMISLMLILVGLMSGCIGQKFTEDAELLKIANSIPPPFNITDNMTFRYGKVISIEKNNWYKIDVYIEYLDTPWINSWWGSMWFKEDGTHHFIKRG